MLLRVKIGIIVSSTDRLPHDSTLNCWSRYRRKVGQKEISHAQILLCRTRRDKGINKRVAAEAAYNAHNA
jgi:hypothetical protein